jgi:putative ABC transport system permease protein
MSALVLFYRMSLRPVIRQPGRALLIVFAIALGTAAVLAIDLAGDAAAGSFRASMETLAGTNNLEVTTAGGVPDEVVGQIVTMPYPLHETARVEDFATVNATGATVPLIGVDLVAAANDASWDKFEQAGADSPRASGALKHINDDDAVYVTRRLAQHAGDRVALLINDHVRTYTVRGIVPQKDESSGDLVLMDIGAAQAATGKLGRVDRILIRTPAGSDATEWQKRLEAALPAGFAVRPQGSQTEANRKMLAAFRWNLRVLSYIALLVGAFLIYNALSVAVVRRRAEIGTMRALGASRGAVLTAFVLEAALFGALGAALAIPLGRVMAAGAVKLLAATVNALYVSSSPGDMHLTFASVLLALTVGVAVSVVSAIAPAREAASVAPTEAMARGRREYDVRVHRRRDAVLGLLLALAGAAAAQAPEILDKPVMGYLAALLFVSASALMMPLVVSLTMVAGASLLRAMFGAEGLLAARSLGGSLRRTSVLIGALSTAIAMMTSVGIMVGSFRQTVMTWMDNELPADLYLRPAGGMGSDQHPTIAPEVVDRIAHAQDVAAVSRFRAYEITYQGLPATLAGADVDRAHPRQGLTFLSGRRAADVLRELAAVNNAVVNNAVVSEPFAIKHRVRAGDTLTVPLGGRVVTLRVLDVFYDYGNEAGMIFLDRATMLKYLPDAAPSNLAVWLQPGVSTEQGRAEVQRAATNSKLFILSNGEIRRAGIRVFDQTFAITYALEAVSILVAIGGVAGALIAMVIDRRREFGLLRFLGASSGQVRRIILAEAGIVGLLANAAGLALGYVLSLVLVYVINKQSFGWTIQFHWPVAVLIASLSGVYVATLLAAVWPARMAVRLNAIEAVHEE